MRSMLHSAALIDTWFDTLRPEQAAAAQRLREIVLEIAPGLAQSIKWGNLMFSHAGAHAIAIVAHRDHLNLQLFNGALLAEQFPVLEGQGKGLRHLRVRLRQPVDEDLVRALVQASVDELMG